MLKVPQHPNRAPMNNRLDAGPALRDRVREVWPRSEEVVALPRQTIGEVLRGVRADRLNSKGDRQKSAEQRSAGNKEDLGGGRALSDPDPRNYKRDLGVDRGMLPELSKMSRPHIPTRAEWNARGMQHLMSGNLGAPSTNIETRGFRDSSRVIEKIMRQRLTSVTSERKEDLLSRTTKQPINMSEIHAEEDRRRAIRKTLGIPLSPAEAEKARAAVARTKSGKYGERISP